MARSTAASRALVTNATVAGQSVHETGVHCPKCGESHHRLQLKCRVDATPTVAMCERCGEQHPSSVHTCAPIPETSNPDVTPKASALNDSKHAIAAKAGWSVSGFDASTKRAILSLGATPEAVATFRPSFVASYIGRMFVETDSDSPTPEALDFGSRIARMAGAGAKEANNVGKRTNAQETAYATARKAWERLLKFAGVVTVDARGGARVDASKVTAEKAKIVPPTSADKVSTLPAASAPAVPKFAKPSDALAFLRASLAMFSAGLDNSPRGTHPMLAELAKEITGAIDATSVLIGE